MRSTTIPAARLGLGWLPFIVWLIALTVLSSMPGQSFGPLPFPGADKLVHVALFIVGSATLMRALLRTSPWPPARLALIGGLIMLAIGGMDEFHQRYTPGRSGNDPGDLAADAVGSLIGIAAILIIHARRPVLPHSGTPSADRPA